MRQWLEAGILASCLALTLSPVSAATATTAKSVSASVAKPATKRASTPDLRSGAFYILDQSDSKVLAARNERVAVPIASITKLMTALVVLEAGQPMNALIPITQDDVRATAGNQSRLPSGAKVSRSDLLHLALMSSENRAAQAVCRAYPGGLPACVRAMNRKAKALGMTSARFVEPTGLSSGNVSSPADLAKLVRATAANPTIRKYSTDANHTVNLKGRAVEFRNTNTLVDNAEWHVTVQKTGYIADAGRCLVMQSVIDGRDVVIVLLNSWGKLTRIGDANRIRHWLEANAAPKAG